MSLLIAASGLNFDFPTEKKILKMSGGLYMFSEIGIAYTYQDSNKLEREVGFGDLKQAQKFLLDTQPFGFILYANYGKNISLEDIPPIFINENYAYGSAGNVLTLKKEQKNRTDQAVFVEEVLKPASENAPDLFKHPSFFWMMRRLIRDYVAQAFLHSSGQLYLVNHELFDNLGGVYYVDFYSSKKTVTKDFSKKPEKTTSNGVFQLA